ncbi:MAG: sigma-54-dependent transcriptional regulator [Desulfonatronovibrionaceae bacterium]
MVQEKVLLVDDEKDFVDVLTQRMKGKGLEVKSAYSGQEALKAVDSESFDAIILDMKMPDMDGIETLKKMKQINPDLQVILLTGHATVDKGVEAMKLGAMDFLEKPAEINALLEKIHKANVNTMLIHEKKTQDKIHDIIVEKAW